MLFPCRFLAALLGISPLLVAQATVPSSSGMPASTNGQQAIPIQIHQTAQDAPGGASAASAWVVLDPGQYGSKPHSYNFSISAIAANLTLAKDILAEIMKPEDLKTLLAAEDAKFGTGDSDEKLKHRRAALTSAIALLKGPCK
jgi:hypothetical protein